MAVEEEDTLLWLKWGWKISLHLYYAAFEKIIDFEALTFLQI